ncbi:DNA-processing protein DprA [Pseudomonas syringae]|uniref:DNA-processing protein DprA n=1 Tax=Pseudomonas syringae TaxID=317 RepID=UPI00165E280C|nr:DNA-processing protein DprA [Pseudomonas syringae]
MSEISSGTKKILALSMLKGVGPATLRKIASMPDFAKLQAQELAVRIPSVSKALDNIDAWDRAIEDSEAQIEEAKRFNSKIISPLDIDYPLSLAATKDDPFLLYVKGSLSTNSQNSVAIIGTREPTSHGIIIAQRVTHFFAENDWSVVSGLAIGCDAIAHQAALDAQGHTIAVLAHGLHTIAPSRHRKLSEDILDGGGALVSEYRFGQGAQPQQFVKRDRTQAGLAQGVVMIQSDLKGGSLHASRAALNYGRWLAVPYPTVLDLNNREAKTQGNLLLADGSDQQKEELLRCSLTALDRLIILRTKEDYPQLLNQKIEENHSPPLI